MLIYFKVGNYKSIKDPIILNFNAAAISEHAESNVIEDGSVPLLKSILLYGHNASGKSKILDAFGFFRWFVINSAIERQRNEPITVEPFELNEVTISKPSFFEVSFVLGEMKYRYGFEADREKVHKEWLLETKVTKEYPVFLRIGEQFEIHSKRFDNSEGLEKRTRKNALFLSVASQWNVKKAEQINEWFSQIFTIHGLSDELYKNITLELLEDKNYADQVKQFIKNADLGIHAIELTKVPLYRKDSPNIPPEFKNTLLDEEWPAVFTFHQKYNEKGEVIGNARFFLDEQESEGTNKYFNLIGVFIKAIAENRIVVIDEFDARLHTLLTKSILKLFNSSKTKSKAQLLAASHDTALLDRDLLRRDQIYFVEKNKYGATEVTSLVEYKPRKESPYDKNYLEGKYGAIPFIDGLESLLTNG
jgi:AAA15 family ATPase/GTPase